MLFPRIAEREPATDKLADPQWAWAPFQPDARRPWTLALAGHLYRRAAFGGSWKELRRAVADGPQRAVDRLFKPDADVDAFDRRQKQYEASTSNVHALRAWWLRRMIQTPHPLLEKMTLFWHGHFATSNSKVKSAQLMAQHMNLLRRHALGDIREFIKALVLDPALLLWLDAGAHRKARPCEGYAKILLENFTLGPGQASPREVREVARAFTGWFVLRNRLRFIPREHDSGRKKVFGQEGKFSAEDVARILVQQRATSKFLVRKLYRCLVSEADEPGENLLSPLAESFARDHDIARLVETILRSNLFYSRLAYRGRIKSPAEYALGIVKGMEGMVSTARLGGDLADLGQDLCHPPTVNGWPGGRAWIDRFTLLGRSHLAQALLSESTDYGGRLDPSSISEAHGSSTAESGCRFLIDLFLQGDLEAETRAALFKEAERLAGQASGSLSRVLRRFTQHVVTLPEFQLA